MRRSPLVTLPVLAFALACAADAPRAGDGSEAATEAAPGLTPEIREAIEAVREATSRFQDIEIAIAEGWSSQAPEGCMETPDGSQGYHYLNEGLVDAEVDLLRPELVMYEPRADGTLELIGVDYIIPFELWPGDEPPELLGQPFLRNEPLGVWALHIWAWRDNPSGMFAPWNPNASCEFAI